MNNRYSSIILYTFVMCFTFFITLVPVFAENEDFHTSIVIKNGLQLVLETDKSEYVENEIIHIIWNVTNISSEVIPYETRSTCDDGIDFNIYDSDGNRIHPLSETILNIKQNDPLIKKFDSIVFYGEILELIKTNPDKEIILMLFGDRIEIENILKTRHGVDKISNAQNLNFISVQIQVKEIPKIIHYDFIHSIIDGEQRVCGTAMGVEFLTPNESIEKRFSWSQHEYDKNNSDYSTRVLKGHYLIQTQFNGVVNCLVIGILENESLSESSINYCGEPTSSPLDQNITTPLSTVLPKWLKNNAEWWAEDQIDDLSFINALQYLIDEQIIHIPNFILKDQSNGFILPSWLKNNAEWWAKGFVSDNDFMNGIQYMVEHGIIRVS